MDIDGRLGGWKSGVRGIGTGESILMCSTQVTRTTVNRQWEQMTKQEMDQLAAVLWKFRQQLQLVGTSIHDQMAALDVHGMGRISVDQLATGLVQCGLHGLQPYELQLVARRFERGGFVDWPEMAHALEAADEVVLSAGECRLGAVGLHAARCSQGLGWSLYANRSIKRSHHVT